MSNLTPRQKEVLKIRLKGLGGLFLILFIMNFVRMAEVWATLIVFFFPVVLAMLFAKPESFYIPKVDR